MPCSLCSPEKNAPHFALCEACMRQICALDSRRYPWYQAAVKSALFPSKDGPYLPVSLPPVSFPAILDPEICLFRISES